MWAREERQDYRPYPDLRSHMKKYDAYTESTPFANGGLEKETVVRNPVRLCSILHSRYIGNEEKG